MRMQGEKDDYKKENNFFIREKYCFVLKNSYFE